MRDDKTKNSHDELRALLNKLELNETYYKILEVACRSYALHVTQADTIKIIREHFEEKRESHRLWWITDIVKKGRKQGEDNWRIAVSKLRKIPIPSEDKQVDSDPGTTAEDVDSPPGDDTAIKLLKSYFEVLDLHIPGSFIGKSTIRAYNQGLSVEQTVQAIETYFYENDLFHSHDWIRSMVIGARKFAARNETEIGLW